MWESAIRRQSFSARQSGRGIPAQVDDMAQMIGRKIPCCLHVRRDMLGLLRKYGAVLVPRVGVVVSAGTADDVEALKALVAKAAVCCLHVRATARRQRSLRSMWRSSIIIM